MARQVLSATTLCCLLILVTTAMAAISLGTYNIEVGSVTTSGISSGAVMATQFHVAHSSLVNGVGIFAGVPYGCALGLIAESIACMQTPLAILMVNLYLHTNTYDGLGSIDSTAGLRGDRVFIYHGSEDSVVKPGSALNVRDYYEHYGSTIMLKNDIASQHCMPSDSFGGPCGQLSSDHYINNCGYNGAYEMANYVYGGGLTRPSGGANLNNLFEFDQREFFSFSPSLSAMDDIGYVYIPTRCAGGAQCKLHIAFHGCQQGREVIGNTYVVNGGYLETAEANNIIVLFPQVIKKTLENPQGCWDWWGYNVNIYDTRSGNQILAVYRMITKMMTGRI